MLSLLGYALLGIIIGTVTGIVPGLHINTIALLIFTLFLKYSFDPLLLSVFIVSMGVTHSFLQFIPSLFFGAPDPDTALSVLPGHKMLLGGDGYSALLLTVSGGLFGMIALLLSFPLLLKIVPFVYTAIRPYVHFVLIVLMAYLIVIEKRKGWAIFVFFLSGIFGLIAMSSPINRNEVLFPVLSGLFGISTLLLSYKSVSSIPEQNKNVIIEAKQGIFGGFAGFVGGVVAAILPGFGSSQSAILIQQIGRFKEEKNFLAMQGAINTIDIIFSIFCLYLVGNPRSGSAVIIGEMLNKITLNEVLLFLSIALIATGIAVIATLFVGKRILWFIEKINYKKLVLSILIFLFVMTFVFTSFLGLLVALIGTAIGLLPQIVGVKKSLAMGCLIFPTILYFSGLSFVVLSALRI